MQIYTRRKLPARFLDQVIARIHNALGGNLIAIVLFGSFAKGTAHYASDLDLLVIARALPSSRKRDALLNDVFDDLIIETGIAVMPILMTERELRYAMQVRAPLLYGIITGYRVAWGALPVFSKWEHFVRDHYRLSRKYDAWIIKDRTHPQPIPNLT
jgi:predicted nucleotidyltransferase